MHRKIKIVQETDQVSKRIVHSHAASPDSVDLLLLDVLGAAALDNEHLGFGVEIVGAAQDIVHHAKHVVLVQHRVKHEARHNSL